MTDLMGVLAPPKKKKAPTDPHQLVLKRLARSGWSTSGRNVRPLLVRQYGETVFITNTYMMAKFDSASDIATAIRSVIPETHETDSTMANGFQMDLSAGLGGTFDGLRDVAMDNVWPTDVPGIEITSWEPSETDPELVSGDAIPTVETATLQQRVLVSLKQLKACINGIEGPRVFANVNDDGIVTKPLVITDSDGTTIRSIVMPKRQDR
jgi:hypothetical protein